MTAEERQSMKKFEAKVRQVLTQFRVLKKENADLYTELESKDAEIAKLKEENKLLQADYNNLRLAKMIEVSDGDIQKSRQKITNLVREVNKCISILTSGSEESA